jgi:hypothetical protein
LSIFFSFDLKWHTVGFKKANGKPCIRQSEAERERERGVKQV